VVALSIVDQWKSVLKGSIIDAIDQKEKIFHR
jgi:hypothetical protein